jgi:hypothetical protein
MCGAGLTADRNDVAGNGGGERSASAPPAEPAGRGRPFLYQEDRNLISGTQRRSAFAVEQNIIELVKQHGLRRVCELTLTTRDNCLQHWDFQARWHSFMVNVGYELFSDGVYVKARQERGAIHLHAAVVMPFDVNPGAFPWDEVEHRCYKHVDPRLRKLWRKLRAVLPRYGFGRFTLQPIRKTGKALGRYLASYYGHNFLQRDDRDRSARLWGAWGSARRCKTSFAFVSSNARLFVKYWAWELGFREYSDFGRVLGSTWGQVFFRGGSKWGLMRAPIEAVRGVASLLRHQFFEDADWLAGQFAVFPNLSFDEILTVKPHLEGLLTWEPA